MNIYKLFIHFFRNQLIVLSLQRWFGTCSEMDRISQMVWLLQNLLSLPQLLSQLITKRIFRMNPSQTMGEFRKTIKNYSYFLNDTIGKGYSSTVYTGVNDQTGEKVAIKVIELKFIKDQTTRKLLQTQLECIKKIKHRNLLRFIQCYQTSNNLYIITEFCDGGDLQKQLKTKGRFTEVQLINFFAQFYAGYTSLLETGFIHRDIKPANILIRKGKIRIADFGIVKKTSQNPKDKYSVGTIVYMSPQSLSFNIFTEKSDVWSIGVMCYQLVHGKFPWKSNPADKQAIINEILSSTITFDSSWLSVECIKFINQCLDRNSNTRIGLKEMLGHPWMKNVIPLIKQNRTHRNPQNLTEIKHEQIKEYPFERQRSKNNSLTNIPNLEINKKSTSLTNINTKINFSNSIQSPSKSPMLKFTYKNQNDANAENSAESSFQKMRVRILGNPTQLKINLLSSNQNPQLKQETSTTQTELEINNFVMSILIYTRKIHTLIKQIEESTVLGQEIKSQLYTTLLVELARCMRDQEIMARSGDNIYTVTGWELFRSGNKWRNYELEVQEFLMNNKEKYENQLHLRGIQFETFQYVQQRRFLMALKHLFEDLKEIVEKRFLSLPDRNLEIMELFQLIGILDKLVSLYQFEQVLFYKGWQFLKNTSEMIEQEDAYIGIQNYQEVWQLVQVKIQIIFQS